MTDKRDKALEWIERQIRQTRQALGRAEYKPGVKPEELENLRGKIEVLEFISGAVLAANPYWRSVAVGGEHPIRLIDANALLAFVKERYTDVVAGAYPFNIVAYDMAKAIEAAPTFEYGSLVMLPDAPKEE